MCFYFCFGGEFRANLVCCRVATVWRMSGQQTAQKLSGRRSSPSTKREGPLRATLPVSFMSQNIHLHSEVAKTSTVTSQPPHSAQTPRSSAVGCPSAAFSKTGTPIKQQPIKNNPPTYAVSSSRSRQSPWRIRQWSPTLKGISRSRLWMNLDSLKQ